MPIKRTIKASKDFRQWLFAIGTRVVEIANGIIMTCFAMTFLLDYQLLITNYPYRTFTHMSSLWLWFIMLLIGIAQLIAMACKSIRSNQFSALVLIWSGCVWAIVAVAFGADYPPLSSAFFTYLTLALLCALAGKEMMSKNKKLEGSDEDF